MKRVRKGPVIKLSKADLKDATELGEGRQAAKKGRDPRHQRGRSGKDISIEGTCGEYAYGFKHLGVEIDREFYPDGDGQMDLRHNGWNTEVRTTSCEDGHLIVDPVGIKKKKLPKKNEDLVPDIHPDLDILVLVHCIKKDEYQPLGFIPVEDFLDRCFIKDFGQGKDGRRFACRQDQLFAMADYEWFRNNPGPRRPLNQLPDRKQSQKRRRQYVKS